MTANAVRFYERYGVISAHRNSGNARRFTVDAVCRIRLALAAQRVHARIPTGGPVGGPAPALMYATYPRVNVPPHQGR